MAVPGHGHAGTGGQHKGQIRGQARSSWSTGTAGTGDRGSSQHSQPKEQGRKQARPVEGTGQRTGLAQGSGDQASIASQRDRAKDNMPRAGDRHSCPRAQAQPAQGTDTAMSGYRHSWHRGQGMASVWVRHSQNTGQGRGQAWPSQGIGTAGTKGQGKGQAYPEQGIGQGTGITIPDRAGDRHSCPGPPRDTPGDQPRLGKGPSRAPGAAAQGPTPTRAAAMSEQCPGLSPGRGSLSTQEGPCCALRERSPCRPR